jgi:hypothetical protein
MTDEQPSRWEDLAFDDQGRLVDLNGPLEFVDFGPPPPITWIPVMDLAAVFGRRAATLNSQGPTYDLRIASEAFEDAGGWYIHLVGDDQWWDWLKQSQDTRPARPPHAVCWPARYVWIEIHQPWTGTGTDPHPRS